MHTVTAQYLRWFSQGACVALPMLLGVNAAHAEQLNAGAIETHLDAANRYAFMSGVVEGLAYARYVKDGKQPDGMACIYRWFYADGTAPKVEEAFKKFPDYMPGPIILAMTQQACGE